MGYIGLMDPNEGCCHGNATTHSWISPADSETPNLTALVISAFLRAKIETLAHTN